MVQKYNVLIAGIGGASLGTEILKSLLLADRYNIYGCDISELAYGHYLKGFEDTFIVDPVNYAESVLDVCHKSDIDFIIPGGEEPMVLLSRHAKKFTDGGICLAANSPNVIKLNSDKMKCFENLSKLGFQVPLTKHVTQLSDLNEMIYPCVVKPAIGSGGSSFVFLAADRNEASLYLEYLHKNGKIAIVQEYIPDDEGEFTVGVLSLPNREIACSVALKRIFNSKLSIFSKGKVGLISSGYTQGLIDDFPDICAVAEKIAIAIQADGPINVQGRVKNGVFVPFEINPRFSASTYLRAMAGVNEIDIYLQYLATGSFVKPQVVHAGYYLRSFSEVFVNIDGIKND